MVVSFFHPEECFMSNLFSPLSSKCSIYNTSTFSFLLLTSKYLINKTSTESEAGSIDSRLWFKKTKQYHFLLYLHSFFLVMLNCRRKPSYEAGVQLKALRYGRKNQWPNSITSENDKQLPWGIKKLFDYLPVYYLGLFFF